MTLRKRALACVTGLLALGFSVGASALGMGEIKLHSALNEPLNAEIPLVGVGEIAPEEILVSLGAQSDFDRAGIEREFFLVDLDFKVDLSGPSGAVIRVASRKAVKEPYLDFLVNLRWPGGRLQREYTLLLDPPVFAAKRSPQQPQSRTSAAPREPRPSEFPTANDTESASAAERQYTVAQGDTLWEIASRSAPAGATVQQTMMAIQAQNPDAFIDGNINRLISGRVLRLPSGDEIDAIDQRSASGQVAAQTHAWQDTAARSAPPLDARPQSDESTAVVSPDEGDGQLSLSAGPPNGAEAGGSPAAVNGEGGGDASTGGQVTAAQLVMLQEELNRVSRENQALKEQLANIEEQLKISARIAQIESDPMRAAQLAAAEQSQPDAAAAPNPADATVSPPSNESPGAPAGDASPPADPSAQSARQDQQSADSAIGAAPSPAVTEAGAAQPAPQALPPELPTPASQADAATEPPASDDSIFASLNRYLLGILGVVGATILALLYLAIRKRNATAEMAEGIADEGLPAFRVPQSIRRPAERQPARPAAAPLSPPSPDDIQLDEEDKLFAAIGSESSPEPTGTDNGRPRIGPDQGEDPESRLAALSDEILSATSADKPLDQELELDWPLDISDDYQVSTASGGAASESASEEAFELDLGDLELDAPENSVAAGEAEIPLADQFDFDVAADVASPAAETGFATKQPDLEVASRGEAEIDLDEEFDLDRSGLSEDFDLEKDFDLDKDFDLGGDQDALATQLELAQAYVDMDDTEGAKEILADVIAKGNAEQREKARVMLSALG